MWEQLPDGSVVPTEVRGPRGIRRYPYSCASAGASCEPLIRTPDERMVRELGLSINHRFGASGRKGKRR
jgi:hypothetical protein